MGVPSFFRYVVRAGLSANARSRWIVQKYPKLTSKAKEDRPIFVDGHQVPIPVQASKPNPNGTEYDNLYLDMNGIIHPCTHPENKPAPKTEDEMYLEIFNYVCSQCVTHPFRAAD